MANAPKTITVTKGSYKGLVDAPHAPFVFFDGVPAQGTLDGGLVTITLSAQAVLLTPEGDGTNSIPVVVAYLRTNRLGAKFLRDALDGALSMGDPSAIAGDAPQGPAN